MQEFLDTIAVDVELLDLVEVRRVRPQHAWDVLRGRVGQHDGEHSPELLAKIAGEPVPRQRRTDVGKIPDGPLLAAVHQAAHLRRGHHEDEIRVLESGEFVGDLIGTLRGSPFFDVRLDACLLAEHRG
ncbi:hypothetical protein GCM10011581_49710 [Saccharopolyspora subtropica]|uniref:Uncharacterized protein n=1 Tax=Saccharopolyspora thermophila TaxID=89367 RepID=A0A917NK42_9PSEU|nr:hypothetical protein [Saccharopolyspora subtropica]GGJ06803.1 hypothetical protein GCM10011581_49710 [Saccharopolyspora subtropica]